MERHERAHPTWGWKTSLATAGIFAASYLGVQVISLLVLVAAGFDLDNGVDDDNQALLIFLIFGLIQQAASVLFTVWFVKVDIRAFIEGLGLNRWRLSGIWRPALMTLALYGIVAAWAILLEALDIGWLEPDSGVDEQFVASPALVIVSFFLIVVGAPLSEEFVFRGGIFGGLSRYGFWPAALVSGGLFGLVHLQIGMIPAFALVGIGLAYLYWSRGSLWDSIICHGMFNFTSYLLLVAGDAVTWR